MKLIIFDADGVLVDNYELHYKLSKKQITGITREEHRKLFEGNIHVEREGLERGNPAKIISDFEELLKIL